MEAKPFGSTGGRRGEARPRPRTTRRDGRRMATRGGSGDRSWLDPRTGSPSGDRRRPALEHDSALFRQPITTLDEIARARLASRRSAIWSTGSWPATTTTTPILDPLTIWFGPPVLAPPSLRDGYGFEGHVGMMWRRRDAEIPGGVVSPRGLLLLERLGASRTRRAGLGARRLGGARLRAGGRRPDRHARRATCQSITPRRRSGATRSSTTGPPVTSSATRRRSASARTRARTLPSSIGPWLVTPDELEDARRKRIRPRDDGDGERRRDVARALVGRGPWVRPVGRRAPRPT